jgi:hypothetical protein
MVEAEIASRLSESLTGSGEPGKVFKMKKDFRRLEARYVCTAEEYKHLCTGYSPSIVGSCRNFQDGACTNSGVLNG